MHEFEQDFRLSSPAMDEGEIVPSKVYAEAFGSLPEEDQRVAVTSVYNESIRRLNLNAPAVMGTTGIIDSDGSTPLEASTNEEGVDNG